MNTQYLSTWVSSSQQNPTMGLLPAGAYVIRVTMHCTEAFNSDGTDLVRVGYSGTTNAYATDTNVASTGLLTPTLGANVGFQSTARIVTVTYTNGGSEPTAGKAVVVLEYFLTRTQP